MHIPKTMGLRSTKVSSLMGNSGHTQRNHRFGSTWLTTTNGGFTYI